MTTFEECKTYFKCDRKGEYSDDNALSNAIEGKECEKLKEKQIGQSHGIHRCRDICNRFKDITDKKDRNAMVDFIFYLSDEFPNIYKNERDTVLFYTLTDEEIYTFLPISQKIYKSYENIFKNYFRLYKKRP